MGVILSREQFLSVLLGGRPVVRMDQACPAPTSGQLFRGEACNLVQCLRHPFADKASICLHAKGVGQVGREFRQGPISLLALAQCLLSTYPFHDSAQPLGDGIEQASLFLQEGALIHFRPPLQVVDLDPAGRLAVHLYRAALRPDCLSKALGLIDLVIEDDAGAGDIRELPGPRYELRSALQNLWQGQVFGLDQLGDAVEAVQLFQPFPQFVHLGTPHVLRALEAQHRLHTRQELSVGHWSNDIVVGNLLQALGLVVGIDSLAGE